MTDYQKEIPSLNLIYSIQVIGNLSNFSGV